VQFPKRFPLIRQIFLPFIEPDIPAAWNQISETNHVGDLMHLPNNIIFDILIIRW
jgi:hypothetical protein